MERRILWLSKHLATMLRKNISTFGSRCKRKPSVWFWTHRSNRSAKPVWPPRPVKPVRAGSGFGRYPTGPNSKFKFEFKKWKIFKEILKILQGATNIMVQIFSKIRSFSIVCRDLKLNQKRKRKKWTGPIRPTAYGDGKSVKPTGKPVKPGNFF